MSFNHGQQQVEITQAAPGTTELVAAPGAGLRVHVTFFAFSVDTAATIVKFTSGGVDLTGDMEFADGAGIMAVGDGQTPILVGNENGDLDIVTTTGSVEGWLRYYVAN